MLAMKDHAMTGCINTAYQVVASCGALQALAAVNSPAVPQFDRSRAEAAGYCFLSLLISTMVKVLPSTPKAILSPFFRCCVSDTGRTL